MPPPPTTLEAHLLGAGPKRILSLDGGGIRGIVTLGFLERIEALLRDHHGAPELVLSDHFDLIGGTSTGAIIASGLALGHSVAELIDIYVALGRQGFQRRLWFGGMLVPKFRTAALDAAIRTHVADITLGSPRLRTGLGIVAKRLDTGSVWVFHNHPRGRYFGADPAAATYVPNRDLPLAQLVRASSAAPSYFDPEYIEIAPGLRGAFVDGGISPHGNPGLQLLMLATLRGYGFRWPMGVERLSLVSVGTGNADAGLDPAGLRRMPAAWLAITALRSLMRDCDQMMQGLLQWFGETPTPWPIDSEIGDLADDRPGPAKLLHYVRYDAPIDRAWLRAAADLDVQPAEIRALQAFDDPRLAPLLLEIGRRVADRVVRPEHLRLGHHQVGTPAAAT